MKLLGIVPLLAAVLLAQDGPAPELKALQEKLDKSEKKGVERYAEFKPQFEAFATKHAGTEEALTAKLWLLENTGWLREKGRPEATQLIEAIIADYPKSKQLARIAEWTHLFSAKKLEGYLETIRANSPHDEVKGVALLGLARLALRNGSAGKAKSDELLKTLKEQYPNVPFKSTTCGKFADALLNKLKPADLEIGKKAPDIEGATPDGKPLKLSEFRGKVIVLDFWGDW